MANNYETFLELYNAAPDKVKALIDSDLIGEFVSKISAEHNLEPTLKASLISAIADSILDTNLTPVNTLGETSLDSAQVTQIAEETDAFIKTALASEVVSESIHPLTPNDNRPDMVESTTEIEELEETINSLPKMRTMAVDMKNNQDKETTQSTSQEDLLKRKS